MIDFETICKILRSQPDDIYSDHVEDFIEYLKARNLEYKIYDVFINHLFKEFDSFIEQSK